MVASGAVMKSSTSTKKKETRTSSTDLAALLAPQACPRIGVATAAALLSAQAMTAHAQGVEENEVETPSLCCLRPHSSLADEPAAADRPKGPGAKRPRPTDSRQQVPVAVTRACPKRCHFPGGTGLYYDAVHVRHHHPQRKHPEQPERVEAIMAHLASRGLLDKLTLLRGADAACYDALASVHNTHYLQRLRRLEALSATITTGTEEEGRVKVEDKEKVGKIMTRLQEEAQQFDSVYFNEATIECARKAAGGLMLLVEAVMRSREKPNAVTAGHIGKEGDPAAAATSNSTSTSSSIRATAKSTTSCSSSNTSSASSPPLPSLRNGLALIRPPGHHAEAHHARGFCLLNNVAIAAQFARQTLGVGKVLICDWDVHHGQGTQQMFWKDASVLYFSVHRYDHGRFFPGTGSPGGVGEGEGEGFTVNVAWNEGGMGDREYREVWRRVLLPVARAFEPDLILVSAGFDGAKGDGMGGCEVTGRGGFGWMTRRLVEGVRSAQGRVVLALEGGYKLSVLGECVEACVGGLMGEGEEEEGGEEVEGGGIREEAVEAIERTIAVHRKYWPCLAGGGGSGGEEKEETEDNCTIAE